MKLAPNNVYSAAVHPTATAARRPRQETLADSLLVKPLRQLITQQRQRDGLVVVGIHAFVDDSLPLGFNECHRRFGVIVRQEEIIE